MFVLCATTQARPNNLQQPPLVYVCSHPGRYINGSELLQQWLHITAVTTCCGRLLRQWVTTDQAARHPSLNHAGDTFVIPGSCLVKVPKAQNRGDLQYSWCGHNTDVAQQKTITILYSCKSSIFVQLAFKTRLYPPMTPIVF